MKQLLEELFVMYYKDVYRYLYSLCHDATLSEELVAEVFLQVVKSIGTFRGDADIKTWIFSIARHKWYEYLKKKKREVQTEVISEFYQSDKEEIESRYVMQEVAEKIYELINKESERTKNVMLKRLEGYSFYEIGEMFGISENSARVIDFRGKTKIRQILKEEGYSDE